MTTAQSVAIGNTLYTLIIACKRQTTPPTQLSSVSHVPPSMIGMEPRIAEDDTDDVDGDYDSTVEELTTSGT